MGAVVSDHELIRSGGPGIYAECADVANFAMMIADVVSLARFARLLSGTSPTEERPPATDIAQSNGDAHDHRDASRLGATGGER